MINRREFLDFAWKVGVGALAAGCGVPPTGEPTQSLGATATELPPSGTPFPATEIPTVPPTEGLPATEVATEQPTGEWEPTLPADRLVEEVREMMEPGTFNTAEVEFGDGSGRKLTFEGALSNEFLFIEYKEGDFRSMFSFILGDTAWLLNRYGEGYDEFGHLDARSENYVAGVMEAVRKRLQSGRAFDMSLFRGRRENMFNYDHRAVEGVEIDGNREFTGVATWAVSEAQLSGLLARDEWKNVPHILVNEEGYTRSDNIGSWTLHDDDRQWVLFLDSKNRVNIVTMRKAPFGYSDRGFEFLTADEVAQLDTGLAVALDHILFLPWVPFLQIPEEIGRGQYFAIDQLMSRSSAKVVVKEGYVFRFKDQRELLEFIYNTGS